MMWLVNRQPLILQKIKTWMDMGAIALSFIMKIALHYTHLCPDLPSSAFTLDPCVDLLQLKRVQRWFGQPMMVHPLQNTTNTNAGKVGKSCSVVYTMPA